MNINQIHTILHISILVDGSLNLVLVDRSCHPSSLW